MSVIGRIAGIVFCLILVACAHNESIKQNTHLSYQSSSLPVEVVCETVREPYLVHLHANETTAKAVGEAWLAKYHRGCLVSLVHGNGRYMRLPQTDFSFDPNRIFSDQGRAATIRPRSANTVANRAILARLAEDFIQRYIHGQRLIITLHNNTNGALDIQSYRHRPVATAVFVAPDADPDDYVYVTEPSAYYFFRSQNVNVVLQSHTAPDDGSLSIYAAQAKIPYINIETEHGHVDEQSRLLSIAEAYRQSRFPD